jgi:methyl-accepting chemotaxis protein
MEEQAGQLTGAVAVFKIETTDTAVAAARPVPRPLPAVRAPVRQAARPQARAMAETTTEWQEF